MEGRDGSFFRRSFNESAKSARDVSGTITAIPRPEGRKTTLQQPNPGQREGSLCVLSRTYQQGSAIRGATPQTF